MLLLGSDIHKDSLAPPPPIMRVGDIVFISSVVARLRFRGPDLPFELICKPASVYTQSQLGLKRKTLGGFDVACFQ